MLYSWLMSSISKCSVGEFYPILRDLIKCFYESIDCSRLWPSLHRRTLYAYQTVDVNYANDDWHIQD